MAIKLPFPGMKHKKVGLHSWGPAKIKYKGVFDFERLYREMQYWFKERQWTFYEDRYKHKWKGPQGAEIEIVWRADHDVNEFVRNWITVHFHLWDYKEIDVVQNGVKKKMARARMFINFDGHLELDYQNKWSETLFKQRLFNFFVRYVVWRNISDLWWDKLWYIANKVQQRAKLVLGMESHSDVYDDMW